MVREVLGKSSEIGPNIFREVSKGGQGDQKWLKGTRSGQNWPEVVQEWPGVVRGGQGVQKCPEVIKSDQTDGQTAY